MSHLKERKDKTCLNCGTSPLYGRYCHICGQENLEPKETVWHLIEHFFSDITHFDGKFFSSVKYLMRRPGFLSSEYMIGRRASYLNPIRMYVFTSAIFFIILFSVKSSLRMVTITVDPDSKTAKRPMVSFQKGSPFIQDSSGGKEDGEDSVVKNKVHELREEKFKTVAAYDTAQARLPDSLKDGLWNRLVTRRVIVINGEYDKDSRGFYQHLIDNFLHSFPKILFFSLPFFALILRVLYFRHRQYLYADHGIFTIHLYCATFILMLANILLGELSNKVHWAWVQNACSVLILAVMAFMFIYLYLAMRAFYRQGWFKTFIKYVLLGTMALIVNLFLLFLFLLISALSV